MRIRTILNRLARYAKANEYRLISLKEIYITGNNVGKTLDFSNFATPFTIKELIRLGIRYEAERFSFIFVDKYGCHAIADFYPNEFKTRL